MKPWRPPQRRLGGSPCAAPPEEKVSSAPAGFDRPAKVHATRYASVQRQERGHAPDGAYCDRPPAPDVGVSFCAGKDNRVWTDGLARQSPAVGAPSAISLYNLDLIYCCA